MKKVLKITIILTIIIITIFQINCVYAVKPAEGSSSSTTIKNWEGYNPSGGDTTIDNAIKSKANIIVTVIRNIGIIVSVIALMLIGFKEMTASTEEKSVIKQSLPAYLIGIILVEAVTLIPTIIYNIASKW